MYRTYGSLAVKDIPRASGRAGAAAPVLASRSAAPAPASRPVVRPAAPAAIPAVRPAAPAPRTLCDGEGALRRRCRLERARTLALVVVLVLATTSAGVLLLVRNSAVMKAQYEVSRTLKDARDLDVDTQVVQERIAAATDLDAIRADAMRRLGLQDPSSLQRITVEIPASDRLLLSTGSGSDAAAAAAQDDRLLQNAMNDLEGFFRTLR